MIIQEKINKVAKNGMQMVTFKIDGKTYNSFDAIWNSKFNVGDNVDITTKQNGKYINLDTMTPAVSLPSSNSINPAAGVVDNVVRGILINKTQSPNSYEFGKAGNRFKLYFEDTADLLKKMKELSSAGLTDAELPYDEHEQVGDEFGSDGL